MSLPVPASSRTDRDCRFQDVGFGSGDSILLWSKEYAPAYITGVTSLAGQHAIARESPT